MKLITRLNTFIRLSVLLALALGALPAAQAQFNYTNEGGGITITGYTGSGGNVSIPNTIDGLPVTRIGDEAFSYRFDLTSITIPNSVASIGDGAFQGCTSLTSVTIPASVTSIGDAAFSRCTSLTAFTVNALNPSYSSVDGVLFNKGQTTLIQCPGGKAGSYTIPNTVTSIGDGAFLRCPGLTSVAIPNSVVSIGDEAFAFCPGLTAITVDSLNPLYNSLDGVLFNKSQTLLIRYPQGKTGSGYVIPNTVTSIENGAFSFSGLTSVIIPNSVTRIGADAFANSYSLAAITIPNSVVSIGNGAFFYCENLINVTIGNSVTSIGDFAFAWCSGLTSTTIPDSVTSIGDLAFSNCGNLINVIIGSSVTTIGNSAFNTCYNLISITIPNSATTIGDEAFSYCLGLTNITIGNSVTNIGDGAFSYCYGLTSITIPDSVTSIGSGAFAWSGLTEAYFQGDAPMAGSDLFYFASSPTVHYLPGTTGWQATFAGRPTAPWFLPNPLILTSSPGPGVRTNEFGFTISWATNASVVVEACAELANPIWTPVKTNTLTSGASYFSDPQWSNHPNRFYRLRSL